MTAPFSQGFPSDFSLKKIFPFADKSINIPNFEAPAFSAQAERHNGEMPVTMASGVEVGFRVPAGTENLAFWNPGPGRQERGFS